MIFVSDIDQKDILEQIGFLTDKFGDNEMLKSLGIHVNQDQVLQQYRPPNSIRDEYGPELFTKGFPKSMRGNL